MSGRITLWTSIGPILGHLWEKNDLSVKVKNERVIHEPSR